MTQEAMQEAHAITGLHVRAPARLHLGFLDLNGGLGRRYGSIGLAIDEPATDVTVVRAGAFDATGAESARALDIVRRCATSLGLAGQYAVDVTSAIPAHAGLGSGTQLALAIAHALVRLEQISISPQELANLAGRGARSAIGLAAFEGGGFLIDGGRGEKDLPPPLLVRMDFPAAWRVLLIVDRKAQGAHGDRETEAFSALPPFPEASAARLCHLVLMRLLPGLNETDIHAFGAALTEIQEIVGGHFASAQGGSPWTSPSVGRMAKRLSEAGAVGIGQTSWGPTGFAFTASEAAAQRLYDSLVEDATAEGLELKVVCGRNCGASTRPVSIGETRP
jgi:beta-ribofuranosylaminobenzene 5'-phosphate synthase